MYELEMNGQVVQLNFGMGFLREINRTVSTPVNGLDGVTQNIGLRYTVAKLIDKDVEALVKVISVANKGCEPRVTEGTIDAFVENEETDVDEVFENILGFLKKANATKNATLEVIKEVEKEKAKQDQPVRRRMHIARESLLQ